MVNIELSWSASSSDGKLHQEKVQSIMYLRRSGSGAKSSSSSVVSLSPTGFADAPHEGPEQAQLSHTDGNLQ